MRRVVVIFLACLLSQNPIFSSFSLAEEKNGADNKSYYRLIIFNLPGVVRKIFGVTLTPCHNNDYFAVTEKIDGSEIISFGMELLPAGEDTYPTPPNTGLIRSPAMKDVDIIIVEDLSGPPLVSFKMVYPGKSKYTLKLNPSQHASLLSCLGRGLTV